MHPCVGLVSKSKNPSVSGLTVFGCDCWLDCGCMVLLCVSLCSLVPCGNHARLEGDSGAKRLRAHWPMFGCNIGET